MIIITTTICPWCLCIFTVSRNGVGQAVVVNNVDDQIPSLKNKGGNHFLFFPCLRTHYFLLSLAIPLEGVHEKREGDYLWVLEAWSMWSLTHKHFPLLHLCMFQIKARKLSVGMHFTWYLCVCARTCVKGRWSIIPNVKMGEVCLFLFHSHSNSCKRWLTSPTLSRPRWLDFLVIYHEAFSLASSLIGSSRLARPWHPWRTRSGRMREERMTNAPRTPLNDWRQFETNS